MSDGPALARLRAHIEAEVADGLNKLDSYSGSEWCAIAPVEQEVFGIALHDMPRLVATYWAWEIACGSVSGDLADDPDFADALWAELKVVRTGRTLARVAWAHSDFLDAWAEFANLFGVPYRLAHAFFWKNYFLQVRQGIIVYQQDNPVPDYTIVSGEDDERPF